MSAAAASASASRLAGRGSPRPSSVAMSAAAASASAEGFPEWALLEPYIFRRDDKDSFPDESKAPVRASATTSWGADFSIAFSVVQPPRISRLYAHMPGFPDPDLGMALDVLATTRHLALLIVSSSELVHSSELVQDFFIFRTNEKNPSSCLLKLLPKCTVPEVDYHRGGDSLRVRYKPSTGTPRLLWLESLGLWCGDKEENEELVVAELTVLVSTHRSIAFADICLLRSSFTGDQLGGDNWANSRVQILSSDYDDLWKLSRWQTDTTIPFQRWLCWIDYRQGILFCDVSSKVTKPTISFLRFPLGKSPLTSTYKDTCNSMYGVVSVVDHGRLLKFVNVARTDGLDYEALKPGASFSITCHTLILGDGSRMEWKEDYTITSDDLRGHLPCGIPIFPRVDMDRPHVVHFLYIEFGLALQKMSVLSIDMSTKSVDSFYLYMDINKFNEVNLERDTLELILSNRLNPTPWPFLSCEFPRFCYLSRYIAAALL